MGDIIFITGGARCGKSLYAEELAGKLGEKVCYIATADAGDGEMKERIKQHRKRRPAGWETVEEPINMAEAVDKLAQFDAVILDCLTLWLNNLIGVDYKDPAILDDAKNLIAGIRSHPSPFIVVSNETGWGIVPVNPVARRFRDLAGVNPGTAVSLLPGGTGRRPAALGGKRRRARDDVDGALVAGVPGGAGDEESGDGQPWPLPDGLHSPVDSSVPDRSQGVFRVCSREPVGAPVG